MGWLARSGDEEQIKRRKIRAYFTPKKGIGLLGFSGIGLLSASLFALLAWFGVPAVVTAAGIAISIVPFALAFLKYDEQAHAATDQQIDDWRDEDFDAVIERVRAEAADDNGEPVDPEDLIIIIGFVRFENLRVRHARDDGSAKGWRFKVRVGEDGVTRFTPPSLTVLHFTSDHLIAYQCDLDLLTGKVLNETVAEYFWQDIVALQIDKQFVSWAEEDPALVHQWAQDLPKEYREKYAALWSDEGSPVAPSDRRTTVRLRTNTGTGLEIVVGDERFADYADEDGTAHGIAWRNNESIARLRILLRDRKAGRRS